jgi:hypothetical protein
LAHRQPSNRKERRTLGAHGRFEELQPRLVSIAVAHRFLGVSRSYFYEEFLKRVKTARVGRRTLVDVVSLNALADELIGANQS